MESPTDAPAGRSSSIGLILVRKKWSGQLVPRAASLGAFADAKKSSTTSESVKWPTIGWSCEASPRIVGASAAALARRVADGRLLFLATSRPNGAFLPFLRRYSSAV